MIDQMIAEHQTKIEQIHLNMTDEIENSLVDVDRSITRMVMYNSKVVSKFSVMCIYRQPLLILRDNILFAIISQEGVDNKLRAPISKIIDRVRRKYKGQIDA